MSGINEQV